MTRRDGIACLILVVATLAVYAGVLSSDFVRFDDPRYVTQNQNVKQGLTADGVVWAFTTLYKSNWQPLAWLSHMLDVELFGLEPGGHHATSLLLHVLNAIALYGLLRFATGDAAPSALVAALFALHPTHVESVAWISERKDVLATFFGLLAAAAYVAFTRRGGAGRYGLALLLLMLSLATKPMLVTLPFAFLLLDYWPLGRLRPDRSAWRRVVEKLPFFALAAAVAVLTLAAQEEGGAVAVGSGVPLPERLANALVSYVRYVGKTLWPSDLALLYPHPDMEGGTPWRAWQVALAGGALAAATAAALWVRSRPYLAFGWLWFLGTLVPVIGIVQVGFQAMADRYTYVPCIGLYVVAAWGGAELWCRLDVGRPRLARALALAVLLWLGALAVATQRQVGVWRDSVTLFEHSLAVAPGPFILHQNLANAYRAQGRLDAAIEHYRKAIEIAPGYAHAHGGLVGTLRQRGDHEAAAAHLLRLTGADPDSAEAALQLGDARMRAGDAEAGLERFLRAIELDPQEPAGYLAAADALRQLGRTDEALAHWRRAVEVAPRSGAARRTLVRVLVERGEAAEAVAQLREFLELVPDSTADRSLLAHALRVAGETDEAISEYQRVADTLPDSAAAHRNLGDALFERDRERAIAAYRRALELEPDSAATRARLERALQAR